MYGIWFFGVNGWFWCVMVRCNDVVVVNYGLVGVNFCGKSFNNNNWF